MKKIIRYISGMMLVGFLAIGTTACSPDDFQTVNEAGIPVVANYAENIKVWVDQETNYAHFEFLGAKEVYPVWIVDGKSYSSNHHVKKYYRKAGDYTVEVKMANANGMSDGTIAKTFHVDKTRMSGFGGFVYDSEFNLWKGTKVTDPVFWYAPGWAQIADPTYSFDGDVYTVSLPQATTEQWQGQMSMVTDLALEAGKSYDGSVIFTSSKDHPHVTWKVCEAGNDDNALFYNAKIVLKAGEPVCIWFSNMACTDGIPNVKIVLDFGGNAESSEIVIENFVIKDHANDDGTILPEVDDTPEPTWVAVDSEDNLWNGMKFTNTFYYAPGWGQISDPVLTVVTTAKYVIDFPAATNERWQNQVAFLTDKLALSAADKYDFRITYISTENIGGVTAKLAQTDDDKIFLFEEVIDVVADTEAVFKVINVAGVDITQAKLVLDFGGNPANTNVIIKDIILQKHKD